MYAYKISHTGCAHLIGSAERKKRKNECHMNGALFRVRWLSKKHIVVF
jgi:hypothetical protein